MTWFELSHRNLGAGHMKQEAGKGLTTGETQGEGTRNTWASVEKAGDQWERGLRRGAGSGAVRPTWGREGV